MNMLRSTYCPKKSGFHSAQKEVKFSQFTLEQYIAVQDFPELLDLVSTWLSNSALMAEPRLPSSFQLTQIVSKNILNKFVKYSALKLIFSRIVNYFCTIPFSW